MTDYRSKVPNRCFPVVLFMVILLCQGPAVALEPPPKHLGGSAKTQPIIALIIDDLGNQRLPGIRAIELDGPVACAIMPFTAHATSLAEHAFAEGKEVILHLPMQPVEMDRIAGPGEISLDTDRDGLAYILDQNLGSVPHSVGISNHMGSLITRHPGHMRWLMQELSSRGNLFFIDSFTTPDSVAYEIAIETGIPAARRHIFLDNEQTQLAIDTQFERLKRRARRHGYAIGIGHPYPATLDYLQTALPELEKQGFQLVPVSQIVEFLGTMDAQAKLANELSENQNILVVLK
jgi:polysaccharide deacetylase 2 family uncharacterized protein YibQ